MDIIHYFDDQRYVLAMNQKPKTKKSNTRSILFQKILSLIIHNVHKSDDGRILLINIEYEQNIITLVNIYAPNSEGERCKLKKKLASWVSQYCLNHCWRF